MFSQVNLDINNMPSWENHTFHRYPVLSSLKKHVITRVTPSLYRPMLFNQHRHYGDAPTNHFSRPLSVISGMNAVRCFNHGLVWYLGCTYPCVSHWKTWKRRSYASALSQTPAKPRSHCPCIYRRTPAEPVMLRKIVSKQHSIMNNMKGNFTWNIIWYEGVLCHRNGFLGQWSSQQTTDVV